MRNVQEIKQKLEELNNAPQDFNTTTAISYLNWALSDRFNEWEAEHLLRKYTYEISEDIAITNALKWLLEVDDHIL